MLRAFPFVEPYYSYLTQRLSQARLQHSLGVMQVMDALAPLYGLDPAAAHIAGLVHDAGKELPMLRMVEIAQVMNFPLDDPGNRDPLYLHGPCSAYVVQHEMGINDPLVLEAIFRHSYVGNGTVQSPVFCWCLRFADMLEPGRDWDDLRQRIQPLVFAGQMGEAAHEMMNWLIPFLNNLEVIPHPSQRVLQRKLALLFTGGIEEVPNDQLPV
jgi:predicted HD superfamily hydrolase involved in NAD metabolism